MLNELALTFIADQQSDGWAPDRVSPGDADTSAGVINFLLEWGAADREMVARGVDSLLRYQQPDGGFSTYLASQMGSGADGFTCSHPEVAAFVVDVLLRAGLSSTDEVIVRAADYIRRNQDADGSWQAYWWDGRMYSTYCSLRALQAIGDPFTGDVRDRLVARILSEQGPDGSWGERTTGKNRAFETAMALRILMIIDSALVNTAQVETGIVWLLNHQAMDGGFYSSPMVRIPELNDKEPWKKQDWKLDTITGFGVIGRDQNRFFTTATVLSALTDFLRIAGDRRMIVSLKPEDPIASGTHLKTTGKNGGRVTTGKGAHCGSLAVIASIAGSLISAISWISGQ
jgi:prenyltransferase beta subunit